MSDNTASHDDDTTPAQAVVESDRLVVVKGDQRFTFHCAPGEETGLMQQLRELAADQGHPFTWFDAAMVCHQLGQRMKQQLTRNRPPATPEP